MWKKIPISNMCLGGGTVFASEAKIDFFGNFFERGGTEKLEESERRNFFQKRRF